MYKPVVNLLYHRRARFYIGIFALSFLIFLHLSRRSFLIPSGRLNSNNGKIVVFNRIPKTGSTSVVRIFETLSRRNNFRVYRVAIFNPLQFLNPLAHKALIDKISSISHYSNLIVHGHFYHLNFNQFGHGRDLVYVNILRDPLERLVSKYYFIRFGDDHRPNTHRSRMTNDTLLHQTFDECVETQGEDCNPRRIWVQVVCWISSINLLVINPNYGCISLLDTVLLWNRIVLSHSRKLWSLRNCKTSTS